MRIAARNLVQDIERVFSGKVEVETEYVDKMESGSLDSENNTGESIIVICHKELGNKEAYVHRVAEGVLYIEGEDRRGMIYGIYEFSRWLGVSPWFYFADVPARHRDSAVLPEGYFYTDYPSVEYRGVFINDEEELDKWVRIHLGEETIGV